MCFEIAPEWRGKGVATALLRRVLADAAAQGYRAAVAFPTKRSERFVWDYQGPRLYEHAGFAHAGEFGEQVVMRKALI